MKFSEMPYERPDWEAFKEKQNQFTARMKAAKSYEEARAVFLEKEELDRHGNTMSTLAQIRNTIDTRDEFYDGEITFWNAAIPEWQECDQAWSIAMLESPFRKDFEEEYGEADEIVFKRLAKRSCKLAFYKVLSRFKGGLAWGALTGIRPTKMAYQEQSAGRDFKQSFLKALRN